MPEQRQLPRSLPFAAPIGALERCLIPATGFYEWRTEGKKKRPFLIHRPDGEMLALAGLWEKWEDQGETVESFTILTTTANTRLSTLHDRMPVIFTNVDEYEHWLTDAEVKPLLRPLDDELLSFREVRDVVNNPRNDQPECIEPALQVESARTLFD